MSLLQSALSSPGHLASVIGASILWSKLLRGMPQVPAIFSKFAPAKNPAAALVPATGEGALAKPRSDAVAAAAAAEPAAAQATMLALVREMVTGMLGADVEPDQPLMEAGLDSLGEPWSICRACRELSAAVSRTRSLPVCLQAPWSFATACRAGWTPSCRPPSRSTTPASRPWSNTWLPTMPLRLARAASLMLRARMSATPPPWPASQPSCRALLRACWGTRWPPTGP